MLKSFQDCFAKNTSELGSTNLINVEINLEKREPGFYKPYRYSEKERKIIREKEKGMLENGIIRESYSNFSSPTILVKKKNGDF